MSWEYGQLSTEVYELDKPVGRPFPGLDYWQRDPYLWTLQVMHTSYDPVANQETSLLRYEKWRDGGLVATDVTVTADYQDDRPPGPRDHVWTFHAASPPSAATETGA